ncbi:hypothetical protein K2173_005707 [Erythroxylum novogranatense]|uniref:SET domain-containing protein n=1 Tax=Erythroxylum novogranatense TaxID=1862640 RepID=A0AAV8SR95_9ROSI|nr:hypothetical protein K2173_005707 [Erythroxylum novogranatense]
MVNYLIIDQRKLKMSRLVRWLCRSKKQHYLTNQLLAFSTDNKKPSNTRATPPPIRVSLTESAGRGVFATRRIGAGDLIHTAKPIIAHPSLSSINTVCYYCLRNKLNSTDQNVAFCGPECEQNAKVFYDVEKEAEWVAFHDYCRSNGFKYPLLVKRLACTILSGAAHPEILDILQPASLPHHILLEMEEGFNLLRQGFTKADAGSEKMAFLTKKWYNNVLARIRINAFRIELAPGRYEDLLSSAAACVDAEAAVGNAVYMLPSFYNHDCDPNAHIIWLENADARVKALRDIEPDEELRICYIDASLDHNARQTLLLEGFGFNCNCPRCSSGD